MSKATKAKRPAYTKVAERITAAVIELNEALLEAYAHPQVRVHLGPSTFHELPLQLGCEITRVTNHTVRPTRDGEDQTWGEYEMKHFALGKDRKWKSVVRIETVKKK